MILDRPPPGESAPAARAKRILLVDDDLGIRESLATLLEDEGYEVAVSRDGREALATLRDVPTDLIILDLMMPVMDGWQFRTMQRADPELSGIPVIVVSADGSAQARAVHADHYLTKPFRADDLLVAIERVLLERERHNLSQRLREAERIALLGTMAASVGHEINNPLTYVLGNLHLLRSDLAALGALGRPLGLAPRLADAEALVEDIATGAERIREVVSSLRWLSRPRPANPQLVDLAAVLETSLAIADNEIRHRARVERRIEKVPPISGDETRLGQVLVNLLVNAAQAFAAGSVARNLITVSTAVEGELVVVEVRDNGVGMTAELQRRIFDPFFTTKEATSGTGLGLAISRSIVDQHGGRIEVTSAPGAGSTFRVLLPLPPREPLEAGGKGTAAGPEPRRLRLLVVDDEPLVLTTIGRMLGRTHDVTLVAGGEAALDRVAADRRFDAILCDLMMPVMTGMELHRALEALDPELAERVAFMTGGAFDAEATSFLARVPNPRLEKPFTPEELQAAVLAAAEARPRGDRPS